MANKVTRGLSKAFNKVVDFLKNIPKAFFSINLSRNTGTKFLSLLLAILFWLFVMDQVDPEITKVIENVPVQLINLQELDQNNLIIMNQHDYFVNVEVSGRRNNIINLNTDSIYLWADMRTVKKGSNTIQINKTVNSENVMIQTLLPNEIVITADQIVSLPKAVKIQVNGDYQGALYQKGIVIKPDEIKITGPESIVNNVSYLGGIINVNNLSGDITKEVTLVPYSYNDEVVNGVTLDSNYTSVSLEIGKTKTIPLETSVNGNPQEGYKVVSTTITPSFTTISAGVELTDSLSSINTESINLSGTEMESFIVDKKLILPEGVVTDIPEDSVQIEVAIEQILSKEFNYAIKDIPVVNLADHLKTNMTEIDGDLTVKVKDIESVVNNLAKGDIHLSVNFSNVEKAGLYRLKVNVSDEETFNELSIEPIYIEVEVVDINDTSSMTNETNKDS